MSPVNSDTFASSFPIRMPFVSFFCLIALAGTSSTILNKSGESAHPCLILDFRGKTFSFYPLSMVLTEETCLSYMAFIMLRYFPSIPTLLNVLIINDVSHQMFFCIY